MPVLKTASPSTETGAPKEVPVKIVPSSSTSLAGILVDLAEMFPFIGRILVESLQCAKG